MEKKQLIVCPNCGEQGDNLFRTKEGDLLCGRCGHRWQDDRLGKDELVSTITKVLNDSEAFALQRAVKNLAKAVQDGAEEDIKTYSQDIRRLNPDDFTANFYLTFLGNTRQFTSFLEQASAEEEVLSPALAFVLPRLEPKSAGALKSFLYRIGDEISQSFRDKWVEKIEDEIEKFNSGVYNLTLHRDVFIACSNKDLPIVDELVTYLEKNHVTCFAAYRNLRQIGKGQLYYWKALQEAMTHCRGIVFVSTPNSCSSECEAVCGAGELQGELPWFFETFPEKFKIEYIPKGVKGRMAQDDVAKYVLERVFAGQEAVTSREKVVYEVTRHKAFKKPSEEASTEKPSEPKPSLTPVEAPKPVVKTAEPKKASPKAEPPKAEPVVPKAEQPAVVTLANYDKSVFEIEGTALIRCDRAAEGDIAVPIGVTSIGAQAFSGCEKLTSITIPKGVTSIGEYAFWGCEKLTSITIPKGVTSIGEYAFWGCEKLTSITIPEGVTSIEQAVFQGCSSLTSISIPKSVISIGEYAFLGCRALTQINIPEGVTKIETGAFLHCKSLRSIALPKSVTSLEDAAFRNCGLEQIEVEEGNANFVVEDGVLYSADRKTLLLFPPKRDVRTFTVPDSVSMIGKYAFEGCESLTAVTLPKGLIVIRLHAFSHCKSLTDITIPSTVEDIVPAFAYCDALKKIEVEEGNTYYVAEDGVLYSADREALLCVPAGRAAQVFSAPTGVTKIGARAFCGCKRLISVALPVGVTTINDYAFSGCTSLAAVSLPTGVTTIGTRAFENCTSLADIAIPTGITTIGHSAFLGCTSLVRVTLPQSLTDTGQYVFQNCTSLQKIVFSEGLKTIGLNAFENCTSLQEIDFPDSLEEIIVCAFKNCTSLRRISLGSNITDLHGAFLGCTALKHITYRGTKKQWEAIGEKAKNFADYGQTFPIECTDGIVIAGYEEREFEIEGTVLKKINSIFLKIPNGVTEIAPHVAACPLGTLTFPESVVCIRESAFEKCNLKAVTLAKGLKTIGNKAFFNCRELETITIPEVKEIEYIAFGGCVSLKEIVLPEGLEKLGMGALMYCSSLTSVTLPASLISLEDGLFERCDALKSITYRGTKKQWKQLPKAKNWKEKSAIKSVICSNGKIKIW